MSQTFVLDLNIAPSSIATSGPCLQTEISEATYKPLKNAQAHTLFQVSHLMDKNYLSYQGFLSVWSENYEWSSARIDVTALSPPLTQCSLWCHLSHTCCSHYHLQMLFEIWHSSAERNHGSTWYHDNLWPSCVRFTTVTLGSMSPGA